MMDTEVGAIAAAYRTLSGISPAGQDRALRWLSGRFESEHREGLIVAAVVVQIARQAGRISRRRERLAA